MVAYLLKTGDPSPGVNSHHLGLIQDTANSYCVKLGSVAQSDISGLCVSSFVVILVTRLEHCYSLLHCSWKGVIPLHFRDLHILCLCDGHRVCVMGLSR